jgi:hypothetical protein
MESHTIDLVNKLDEQLPLEVLWIGTREHDERPARLLFPRCIDIVIGEN